MTSPSAQDSPLYLTTREVADLIRVKERKVYDLAAAQEIPHRRVTGKLLFPRDEILHWINGDQPTTPKDRPEVITGSHDPLLDWAIRESACGLATLFNGSSEGLDGFAEGRALASGLHIPAGDAWNIHALEERQLRDCVLVAWARRQRGIILSHSAPADVARLRDLTGSRFVQRQSGAGAQALLSQLQTAEAMAPDSFDATSPVARTESDAAAMVADGDAVGALGLAAMAKRFSLRFVPLMQERYDLVIDRKAYFTEPVQTLLSFLPTQALADKASTMTGYDLSDCGRVRWNAP